MSEESNTSIKGIVKYSEEDGKFYANYSINGRTKIRGTPVNVVLNFRNKETGELFLTVGRRIPDRIETIITPQQLEACAMEVTREKMFKHMISQFDKCFLQAQPEHIEVKDLSDELKFITDYSIVYTLSPGTIEFDIILSKLRPLTLTIVNNEFRVIDTYLEELPEDSKICGLTMRVQQDQGEYFAPTDSFAIRVVDFNEDYFLRTLPMNVFLSRNELYDKIKKQMVEVARVLVGYEPTSFESSISNTYDDVNGHGIVAEFVERIRPDSKGERIRVQEDTQPYVVPQQAIGRGRHKPKYKMILARSLDGVIGVIDKDNPKGKIPWRIKEDFDFFRKMTEGKVVVMGLRTLITIPPAVLKRFKKIYVITRTTGDNFSGLDPNIPTVIVKSIIQLNTIATLDGDDEIWVCGGAQIYELFKDQCSDVYETVVFRYLGGDTPKEKKVVFDVKFRDYYKHTETVNEDTHALTVNGGKPDLSRTQFGIFRHYN